MLGLGGDVGYGGCEPRIEGIVQCTKTYCTKLRKLKKMGVGGGAIFEPKTLSVYLKKKNKKSIKKLTEPVLESTTSGLEKPALLSTRLNTIIAIVKYELENYNIQTAIIKKNMDFVLIFTR